MDKTAYSHDCPQTETIIQFFLGYFDDELTYQDNFLNVVQHNLSSITRFWFDCITSIPWSFLDLHFHLVNYTLRIALISSPSSSLGLS